MPLGMQAKLLRVLEQRQVRPVGSDREVDVDVRILAATNQELERLVREGKFREDLFYRLRVMVVTMPPLRDHREDIAFLAETFLQRHVHTAKLGPRRLTHAALQYLEHYDWAGNVRQLSHVIERAVTLSNSDWIDVDDLGLDSPATHEPTGTCRCGNVRLAGPASSARAEYEPGGGNTVSVGTRPRKNSRPQRACGGATGGASAHLAGMLRRFALSEDYGRN